MMYGERPPPCCISRLLRRLSSPHEYQRPVEFFRRTGEAPPRAASQDIPSIAAMRTSSACTVRHRHAMTERNDLFNDCLFRISAARLPMVLLPPCWLAADLDAPKLLCGRRTPAHDGRAWMIIAPSSAVAADCFTLRLFRYGAEIGHHLYAPKARSAPAEMARCTARRATRPPPCFASRISLSRRAAFHDAPRPGFATR